MKFIIGTDGHVSSAENTGSSLPDLGVIGCVVSGFLTIVFPRPEGGIVTVVYPMIFAPGE